MSQKLISSFFKKSDCLKSSSSTAKDNSIDKDSSSIKTVKVKNKNPVKTKKENAANIEPKDRDDEISDKELQENSSPKRTNGVQKKTKAENGSEASTATLIVKINGSAKTKKKKRQVIESDEEEETKNRSPVKRAKLENYLTKENAKENTNAECIEDANNSENKLAKENLKESTSAECNKDANNSENKSDGSIPKRKTAAKAFKFIPACQKPEKSILPKTSQDSCESTTDRSSIVHTESSPKKSQSTSKVPNEHMEIDSDALINSEEKQSTNNEVAEKETKGDDSKSGESERKLTVKKSGARQRIESESSDEEKDDVKKEESVASPEPQKKKIHSFFTKKDNSKLEKSNSPEKTQLSCEKNTKSSDSVAAESSPKQKSAKSSPDENMEVDSEGNDSKSGERKLTVKKSGARQRIESDSSEEEKDDAKKEGVASPEPQKKKIHSFFTKKSDAEAKDSKDKDSKKSNESATSSKIQYDPSKNHYHPVDDACWKHKEKVPYLALARTLQLIEGITGRLKIIEILSNFLRSVIVLTPEDLIFCVYLCLNRLAPEYEGIELGIGEMVLMRAVAQATGRTADKIKADVAIVGDLGTVAESSRGNQKMMFAPPKLTVCSVFNKFKEIAKMSGNSVMAKKTDKIQTLFVACRECEARYIIRSLSGKLRIGLAEQSVLAALARAAVLTPPNQPYPPETIDVSSKMSSEKFAALLSEKTLLLKTTYCECPNFDLVIPALLKEGIDNLPKHCHLKPGCPLKPMLAHPTSGVDEVLKRFDNNQFTCEFKYDGERAQIHRTESGEVKIFSRNQEDNTSKYPDVISRLSKALKDTTKSFILDTEAVAWDRKAKQILPFQVLTTRKKKDAAESEIVVQVCIMAFDLLFLNGESLVKKTLKERRELLHESFVEVPDEFTFVTYRDGDNSEAMQEFLEESIKGNCEGLMVKSLVVDASYEIAKRSHNWLKLKKDYLGGGDTLDLIVIGGYYGKGKRAGFYGGFLLACYNKDTEECQSICKLGTGFKDSDLEAHTKTLKELVIPKPRPYYCYDSSLEPDVWFDASQVWEIKCADLSISPIHKAALGIVDPEKGISLRFPRFVRVREDKSNRHMEDASDAELVARMYKNQDQVKNSANLNTKTEEDYY